MRNLSWLEVADRTRRGAQSAPELVTVAQHRSDALAARIAVVIGGPQHTVLQLLEDVSDHVGFEFI
jgi:hypothetical protein